MMWGKLELNAPEAEVVRACFEIYLSSSGLVDAVQKLNQQGLTTKAWTTLTGRERGGKPWVAGQLHRVLTHPVYRGLVHHAGEHYEGEHDAIIDENLWERVQKKLQKNQPKARKKTGHRNELLIDPTQLMYPLKGHVVGFDGAALTPTHSSKSFERADGSKEKKRYRYYISQKAVGRGYRESSLKPLNADLLEQTVRRMLAEALPGLARSVSCADLTSEQIEYRLERHAAKLSICDSPAELAKIVQILSMKIIVWPERVQVQLPLGNVKRWAEQEIEAPNRETTRKALFLETRIEEGMAVISLKVRFRSRRGRAQIIGGQSGEIVSVGETKPDVALIRTLAQAEFWRTELRKNPDKSLNEVVKPFGVQPRHVRRLVNAAYLAPEIKRAIFQGRQPAGLQVQDLIAPRSMKWEVQKQELGFSPAEASARQ